MIQINGVVNSVVDSIIRESHNALDNPAMLKVAVNAAVNTLDGKMKVQKKED